MPTKTLITQPSCVTPFVEKNGDNSHCLGNPRFDKIPSFPRRDRCQQVVTEDERTKAAELLKDRAAKETRQQNDLESFNADLARFERDRQWPLVQQTKAVIAACDHDKFIASEFAMRRLEAAAATTVKAILVRLIESFDSELVEYAARREAELQACDLRLFEDEMKDGRERRHYALWDDCVATSYHSCREVCRMRLQAFDREKYSTVENNGDFGIPSLIFLATAEPTDFSWLG
jgi:hypothetical protein